MNEVLNDWQKLTEDEKLFCHRVEKYGYNKYGAEPHYTDDGEVGLWQNPEYLGFIKSTGSYKFKALPKYFEVKSTLALQLSEPEETYTIKLDADSMNEAVVKFLVQCYKDNQMFREDDGIQDSILDVVRYCTTASEYDRILAELGVE